MNYRLPYCGYILFSEKDQLLYIGHTSGLERRYQQHQNGESKSTAPRRPLKLIFAEYYPFKEDALKREMYFKTSMGRKAIKLMLAETLSKLGYKQEGMGCIEILYEGSE